ncbi:GNAT family N-acetyltransferase [Methylocella sp.]|uniref:GNAT family N-acetyltransferase n=1 Tax=Methylocella sp. TaxID=1978226 RepID=UPI0037844C25
MLDQPSPVIIRVSTESDVPAMVEIYAYHVAHGVEEPTARASVEDIRRRRKAMMKKRLPHLVAEKGGVVAGYAYAVPFLKRPAYRFAVKHSIYVRPDHQRAGVGGLLLEALIDASARAGFRQMICYVDSANAPSLRLHERFLFERVGVLKSVAYRFGRWSDTTLLQRPIGDADETPPVSIAPDPAFD